MRLLKDTISSNNLYFRNKVVMDSCVVSSWHDQSIKTMSATGLEGRAFTNLPAGIS